MSLEYSKANYERLGAKEFARQHSELMHQLKALERQKNDDRWRRFVAGLGDGGSKI